jgi:hypothetical protein
VPDVSDDQLKKLMDQLREKFTVLSKLIHQLFQLVIADIGHLIM